MARRKHRGEGSVSYDRANRCWWARVSLGVIGGKRVVKKERAATRDDADDALERMLRAYGAGADPATMTLDAYLDDWMKGHGPSVRASSASTYATHIKLHIKPLLGGIKVARLRPSDVRRLIADRTAAGCSPAYVHRIVTTLHVALQQAVDERSIPDNPAHGVRLPKVEHEPVPAMSEDGADAILDAVRGTFFGELVELLRGSGLRLGEACGLDQGDLHLDESFVLIRRTKTKVRAVSISDDAVAALRRQLKTLKRIGPKEPVFVGPRSGERLRPDSVSHAMPKILVAAGLERVTPHGMRHGVATLMVAAGVPMRHVAEQLGHRNPALTARVYAHVLPESQRDAVKHLNRRDRRLGS